MVAGRRDERPDALEPAHIVRAGRKRNVQVPAFALPRSALDRKAEVVREPAGCRIDVHGGRQNVAALPEDRLSAVAVMGVDVEQRDARGSQPPKALGCHGGVVQVAGSAVDRARNVVARWAAAGVDRASAAGDEVTGRERAVDGRARCFPGAGADERHRVEAERTGTGPRRGGNERLDPSEQPGMREDVRHDPVLSRVLVESCGGPLLPGRAQERHERFVVDGEDMLVGVRLSRNEARAGSGERAADPLRPRGHLRAGSANADPDLPARLVQAVGVAPDDRRQRRHPGGAEESWPSGRGADAFRGFARREFALADSRLALPTMVRLCSRRYCCR